MSSDPSSAATGFKQFLSEEQVELERQKRQAEWERVRKPDEPIEAPAEVFDNRVLYEKFKFQHDEKKRKFENMCAATLWDSLLELRIKLQRATITWNCLPQTELPPANKNDDDPSDEKLREVTDENARLFRKTIGLLLAIETRSSQAAASTSSKRARDSESEIEEDEDEESKTNERSTIDVFKEITKRLKRDDEAVDEEVDAAYERFGPRRDAIVQKWYDRTKSFAKRNKSSTTEQSPLVQIKEIMAVPDRLMKRTQTPRLEYDLVAPPSSPEQQQQTNVELFDDGDFYHQLLREFIERKTASITNPEQINKHWAQLRKLRNKLKKNVDTNASKGRKIRYTIHKKLVNYMAPVDRCSFSDEAKSDLFSSLFGGHSPQEQHRPKESQTAPLNDIKLI